MLDTRPVIPGACRGKSTNCEIIWNYFTLEEFIQIPINKLFFMIKKYHKMWGDHIERPFLQRDDEILTISTKKMC
jgi:hypothetical protein